jgi:integrase
MALLLVHETGHRITSVRCLRWEDIDLQHEIIVWPSEFDKQREEHVTSPSRVARKALLEVRITAGAIGRGWVIPAVKDESKPCPRGTLDRMFQRAEKLLTIDVQPGMRWHSMRRKPATDHKDGSLKVLCELGGWKSPKTVLECYQQADLESQRGLQASRDQR